MTDMDDCSPREGETAEEWTVRVADRERPCADPDEEKAEVDALAAFEEQVADLAIDGAVAEELGAAHNVWHHCQALAQVSQYVGADINDTLKAEHPIFKFALGEIDEEWAALDGSEDNLKKSADAMSEAVKDGWSMLREWMLAHAIPELKLWVFMSCHRGFEFWVFDLDSPTPKFAQVRGAES